MGWPIGAKDSMKFVVLQTHFDNPTRRSGKFHFHFILCVIVWCKYTYNLLNDPRLIIIKSILPLSFTEAYTPHIRSCAGLIFNRERQFFHNDAEIMHR